MHSKQQIPFERRELIHSLVTSSKTRSVIHKAGLSSPCKLHLWFYVDLRGFTAFSSFKAFLHLDATTHAVVWYTIGSGISRAISSSLFQPVASYGWILYGRL